MRAGPHVFWALLAAAMIFFCAACGNSGGTPLEGAPPAGGLDSSAISSVPVSGSSTPPVSGADGSENGDGNNNPPNGGGAQGAPLHIPKIVLNIGVALDTEVSETRTAVRAACGGTDCATVVPAGAGFECSASVQVNDSAIQPDEAANANGGTDIIVPRGAVIYIDGNGLGREDMDCPSTVPAVPVASDWVSSGKTILGPGGAYEAAVTAVDAACGGTQCVTLMQSGGPVVCGSDPQPGGPPDLGDDHANDIKVLTGGTITVYGNSGDSDAGCPDNPGAPDGSSPASPADPSASQSPGTPAA